MTRDERQALCVKRWIENKCCGSIVGPTGFGKTSLAIIAIKKILKQKPLYKVLVIVPTIGLKEQWMLILDKNGLSLNSDVVVINTAATHEYQCDLLVLDEQHRYSSVVYSNIFNTVKYRYIMGLTATFERLDGRHEIMQKYCPIVDIVSIHECTVNGWIALYNEYQVLLKVDDIDEYKAMNRQFHEHFSFFNYEWDTVMKCLGPNGYKARLDLSKILCPYGSESERKRMFTTVTYHATQFMRIVQQRKRFINNHPKKVEIARRIIEMRPNAKIITFSNNIDMAEEIGMNGYVYTGRESKKKSRITLEEFKKLKSGVLHTVKKADTGLDIPGLSVAIMLGIDSSRIRGVQSRGRCIRKEGDKIAEIFVLTINDTVELEWYKKSKPLGSKAIIIDEKGLEEVLKGKKPKPYTKPLSEFTYRF